MIAPRQRQSLAEVVLCSGYPTQLLLTAALRLAGLSPLAPDGTLSLTFVAAISALDTALLVGLVFWLLGRRGERPSEVLQGARPLSREAALGFVLVPSVLLLILAVPQIVRWLAPALRNVPDNPLEALARSPAGLVVMLMTVIVAGGVREELQRGFLLHRFRSDLGGGVRGLLITSVAFGAGHFVQGWDAVIVTTLLGAFWGALYLRRGSVVAPLVSHAIANAAQVVFAYARP
jgi:membrane protease YdiL (CAAX protease family)